MDLTWDSLRIGAGAVCACIAGIWASVGVMVQVLCILMALDILTGLMAATVAKTLDSGVGFRGVCRKVIVLAIVAAAAAVSPMVGGLPLAEVVAGFYCATEALSLLENAANSGVPVPSVLRDALVKLKAGAETPVPRRG